MAANDYACVGMNMNGMHVPRSIGRADEQNPVPFRLGFGTSFY